MDTKFQTSFIPKQPVTGDARPHTPVLVSILSIISFIVFLLSIFAAVGLFFYDQKIDADIAASSQVLEQNKTTFDEGTAQKILRFNDRINSVYTLLKQHIQLSNLFTVLERSTLQNVRFNTFSYTNDSSGNIVITLQGVAPSYDAIALQNMAFTDPSSNMPFRNPLFSDFNLDDSGRVTFDETMTLDPASISYYNNISAATSQSAGAGQSAPVPVQASVASTTASTTPTASWLGTSTQSTSSTTNQ